MSNTSKIAIDVQNIGPIRSAKFDVRPLTVFTGKNNTGKSWLASIVYALFSYTNSTTYRASKRERENEILKKKIWHSFAENPDKILETLQERNELMLNEEEYGMVMSLLNLDSHAEAIKKEIYRCVRSADSSHIIRANSVDDATITVQTTPDNIYSNPLNFSLNVNTSIARLILDSKNKIHIDETHKRIFSRLIKSLSHKFERNNSHMLRHYLLYETLELFDRNTQLSSDSTLYLPAERVGLINNFRTFLSSVLQDNIDSNMLQSSGVNLDFVKKLLDIPKEGVNKHYSEGYVRRLEDKILDGKIKVEHDELNLPQFYFESNSGLDGIPLNVASSMISQIAPVVLFLRYYGESFRMLIIEEPEAHLHPENQVKFIQEICKWVRLGYKILLTTHSEWIIEELSNQVLSNEVEGSKGVEAANVGVWEVRGSKSGSTVREIGWKPDETGYNDGFEKVADKISNTWFAHHERLE